MVCFWQSLIHDRDKHKLNKLGADPNRTSTSTVGVGDDIPCFLGVPLDLNRM